MQLVKSLCRNYLFPTIVSAGAEKYFSRFTTSNFLILNYHGIVRNFNSSLSRNHLSVDQFRKHLIYFKKYFDVVSIESVFESYRNKRKPERKTLAITFDDGYENNLTNAIPLLEEFSFPATVFVTAQTIGDNSRGLWYDEIDLLASKITFDQFLSRCRTTNSSFREIHSYLALKNHFKKINKDEKKELLDQIISVAEFRDSIYSCDPEYWKMLDAEGLQKLASKGIEIGSHSYSHSNLDVLHDDMLNWELKESKKILELAIKKEVRSIAFPDGAYNNKVKELSLAAGYSKLLAVDYRHENDKGDLSILPRFSISNTTTFESVMINIHRAFGSFGF